MQPLGSLREKNSKMDLTHVIITMSCKDKCLPLNHMWGSLSWVLECFLYWCWSCLRERRRDEVGTSTGGCSLDLPGLFSLETSWLGLRGLGAVHTYSPNMPPCSSNLEPLLYAHGCTHTSSVSKASACCILQGIQTPEAPVGGVSVTHSEVSVMHGGVSARQRSNS